MDPSSRLREARKAAKTASFLVDVAATQSRDPHILVSAIEQVHAAMDHAITASLILARRQGLIPSVPSIDRYRLDVFSDVLVKERGFDPGYVPAFRSVAALHKAVADRHVTCDADGRGLVIATDQGSVSVSRDRLRELSRLASALVLDVDGMI